MKIIILMLSITLAFILIGCIETPVTSPKEKPEFTERPIILKDPFLVGPNFSPRVMELNRVQGWVHTSSKQLEFTSLNPPYVVNAAIRKKTSEIETSLLVSVYKKGDPYKMSPFPITTTLIQGMAGRQAFIIEEKGDYIIDVKSVGCEWWVVIGHESEGLRK